MNARPKASIRIHGGIDVAIARGLAYAPYADLIWCETSEPNIEEARKFADAIHAQFPGKLLAYNCSPSFNWKKKLDEKSIAEFRETLGAMGYKFQFITLAGFHALNHSMFELARDFNERGMSAYAEFQQREFESEQYGYTATRHQREVGTGYFDEVARVVSEGTASTTALTGSTEEEQFTTGGGVMRSQVLTAPGMNAAPADFAIERDLPAGFAAFYLRLHERFTLRQREPVGTSSRSTRKRA